jgi:hypothetical protein
MLPLALTLPDNVPIIQAVVFHGSPTVPDIGQLRSAARGWIAARVAPTMRAILDEIVRGPLCIEIRPTESVRLPPYLGHCGRPDAGERRRLAGDHAVLIRVLEPPGGDRPTLWAAGVGGAGDRTAPRRRAGGSHRPAAGAALAAHHRRPGPTPFRGDAAHPRPRLRWSQRAGVLDNPARVSVADILEATAEATTTPDAASGQGVEVALTPSPRGFLDLGPARRE